jgi:serine/threonine protein phosphatase PrpC
VKHGDILVVGSDGLWDNIQRNKIVEVVQNFVRGDTEIKDAELVAEILAKEAEKYSY